MVRRWRLEVKLISIFNRNLPIGILKQYFKNLNMLRNWTFPPRFSLFLTHLEITFGQENDLALSILQTHILL